MHTTRNYSFFDHVLTNVDQVLRTLGGSATAAARSSPAASITEACLTQSEQRHAARLMRVDHVGEVCAQALYQGQALTARTADVRQKMEQSAREENDHLVWCQQRLQQLQSHTSYLNPVWYCGSLFMGVVAGTIGDRWSLGFVAETERQVVKHIDSHLQQLPGTDTKSRAILMQMREDESHHATVAVETGAAELPFAIKKGMRLLAKIMTTTAYWI